MNSRMQILSLCFLVTIISPICCSQNSYGEGITPAVANSDPAVYALVQHEIEYLSGKPENIKSVSIHLSKNKKCEKLILDEEICGTGGCPWLIYSTTERRVIGRIPLAFLIWVLPRDKNGYVGLEAISKVGWNNFNVSKLEYKNGNFIEIRRTTRQTP